MYQESNCNVFFMLASIQEEPGPGVTRGQVNAAPGQGQVNAAADGAQCASSSPPPEHRSARPAAKIVFRVHGIGQPSAELTCQFAGVLQSNVDEMVQRRIATMLMRHRHLKLSESDLAVIAPPQDLPALAGTILIPDRFFTSALPLYVERALQKLLTPLRLAGPGDSREQSPVAAPGASPMPMPECSC
jgi:hypothetical protein